MLRGLLEALFGRTSKPSPENKVSATDTPNSPNLSATDTPNLSATDTPNLSATDTPNLSATDTPKTKKSRIANTDSTETVKPALDEALQFEQLDGHKRKYPAGADVQLSPNFHLKEFESKGPKRDDPDAEFVIIDMNHVERLERLRATLGVGITITSGYRTPKHNKRVGGSPRSRHVKGDATDIVAHGVAPNRVAELAEHLGFDGIGMYDTFTHVDSRGYEARWDFRKKNS